VTVSDGTARESLPQRRSHAKVAATVGLAFAAGAVAALAAKLFLESRWTSLTCGDSQTVVLDRLQLAALTCSTLAVIVAIAALVGHSEHKGRAGLGILVAAITAALILVPDALGGYACGIMTA